MDKFYHKAIVLLNKIHILSFLLLIWLMLLAYFRWIAQYFFLFYMYIHFYSTQFL